MTGPGARESALRRLAWILALAASLAVSTRAHALERFSEVFEPGSKNTATFDILSSLDREVRIQARVGGDRPWLSAVSATPSSFTLEPYGEAVVTLDFSIAGDAPEGGRALLHLAFSAEGDVDFQNREYELEVVVGAAARDLPSDLLSRLRELADESSALAAEADGDRSAAADALAGFETAYGAVRARLQVFESRVDALESSADQLNRDLADLERLQEETRLSAEDAGRFRDRAVEARRDACVASGRLAGLEPGRHAGVLADIERAVAAAREARDGAAGAAGDTVRSGGRLTRLINDVSTARQDLGKAGLQQGDLEDGLDRAAGALERARQEIAGLRAAAERLETLEATAAGIREQVGAALAPLLADPASQAAAEAVREESERLFGRIAANAARHRGRAGTLEGDVAAASERIAELNDERERLEGALDGRKLPELERAVGDTASYAVEYAVAKGEEAKAAAEAAAACLQEAAAQAERAQGELLSDATGALESCDVAAMRSAEAALARREATLDEGRAGALAALRREIAADEAFQAARPAYFAGDLAGASAALDRAAISQCAARQEAIAGRRDKIDRLGRVLARADQAIAACDRPALEVLRDRLAAQSHPLLSAKAAAVAAALKDCEQAVAEPVTEPKDEPEDRDEPDGGADAYADAQLRCEARYGVAAVAYKTGDDQYSCRCAGGYRMGGAGEGCVDQARSEVAGREHCAGTYRRGILTGLLPGGGIACGCPEGLYVHEGLKACLTWDEVVADADAACQAQGRILVEVLGPGDGRCCPQGTQAYDKAKGSCWSWDNLVADARAQCGQQGRIPVQINGINDYVCCPQGTTRFDQASNSCHNDAAAAGAIMEGIGGIMQGLGGLTGPGGGRSGGRSGGGASCANPPPGCHCRPGTNQLHCGGN